MLILFYLILFYLAAAAAAAAGVFVGSGIFKSDHAADRAKAIVQATTHYKDAKVWKHAHTHTDPPTCVRTALLCLGRGEA